MQQILLRVKDDLQVVLLLSYFEEHSVNTNVWTTKLVSYNYQQISIQFFYQLILYAHILYYLSFIVMKIDSLSSNLYCKKSYSFIYNVNLLTSRLCTERHKPIMNPTSFKFIQPWIKVHDVKEKWRNMKYKKSAKLLLLFTCHCIHHPCLDQILYSPGYYCYHLVNPLCRGADPPSRPHIELTSRPGKHISRPPGILKTRREDWEELRRRGESRYPPSLSQSLSKHISVLSPSFAPGTVMNSGIRRTDKCTCKPCTYCTYSHRYT